jgi:LuxR family glucitol operon transcriptional activator
MSPAMSLVIPRLTLYALLSSMEEDMRHVVRLQLVPQVPDARELFGDEIHDDAVKRLARERGDIPDAPESAELLPFIDFADAWQLINRHRPLLPASIGAHFKEATSDLETLVPIRNRVAHSRPLEYTDLPTVSAVVEKLLARAPDDWQHLQSMRTRLRDYPGLVFDIELPEAEDPLPNNLPDAEFDETGWLGRAEQVEKIKKLCLLGGHPVITIFGDGGVGKTSLALKVAYELLDLPNTPFDSIVWATSKTTTLTVNDIRGIEDSIRDSLGLIRHLADELVGQSSSDPTGDVIEYLREFRLLLVVDNLETVLDQRLREFLAEVPLGGSKILLTSRIAVGAYEHPVPLEPMTDDEAIRLLRALADVRGVGDLVAMDNKRLVKYCGRMKNNPLWIRWFVSGVQAGERPEALLGNPDHFLNYALSNVYEYLTDESRQILRVMQSVPGPHSQAQLAFLSDMTPGELQPALLQLATTNMVRMRRSPSGSSFETQYALGELARAYLSKHHPVPKDEHAELRRRRDKLVSAGEDLRAQQKRNPYLARSLDMGSSGNLIVARHLLAALEAIRNEDFPAAEEEIDSATRLAPEWFEVHRIAATLEARRGNYPAAQDRFEAALELAPESAPLRFWYGLFLITDLSDHEAAAEQFESGLSIDPMALDIRLELGRAQLYLEDFDAARETLDRALEQSDTLSTFRLKKLHDLDLQYYMRLADRLSREGNHAGALQVLLGMRRAYERCPSVCIDDRIRGRLDRSRPTARRIVRYTDDERIAAKASEWDTWASATRANGEANGERPAGEGVGIVRKVLVDNGYGFIQTHAGNDLFFHISDALGITNLDQLPEGTRVRYRLAKDKKGKEKAVDVAKMPAPD